MSTTFGPDRYYVCLPKALAMPSVSATLLEPAPAAERIQPGQVCSKAEWFQKPLLTLTNLDQLYKDAQL